MTSTDPLTGLANRTAVAPELDRASRQQSGTGCVAFLDLDGLKFGNDRYGMRVGDEVLLQVATVLRSTLPDGALIARVGGDEFLIVFDRHDARSAEVVLPATLQTLAQPLVDGVGLISASVGIAETDGMATAERLFQRSDLAMHRAKRLGGNQVCVFSGEDNE